MNQISKNLFDKSYRERSIYQQVQIKILHVIVMIKGCKFRDINYNNLFYGMIINTGN